MLLVKRLALVTLLGLPALLGSGCSGGGECGPGEAPPDGVTLDVEGDAITYGAFTSSPNNDCPEDGHPTSLTLAGEQVSPSPSRTFSLTFCLPKPDEIGAEPIPLDGSDDRVQVIDVSGEIGGCIVTRDAAESATGTIAFSGYCRDGSHEAGYAIDLDAEVPGIKTCDATEEPVTMSLSGIAAAEAITF